VYSQARLEDELLIYEAFPYCASPTDKRLKLRFKKLEHGLILRERRSTKVKKKTTDSPGETGAEKVDYVNWLRPFNDICGYSGVSYVKLVSLRQFKYAFYHLCLYVFVRRI